MIVHHARRRTGPRVLSMTVSSPSKHDPGVLPRTDECGPIRNGLAIGKYPEAIQKTGYGRISSYNSDKQRSLRSGSRRSHRCRAVSAAWHRASACCAAGVGPP